mmetsp:Transcript_5994/g.6686  ORF Transcript_5994/g.6686 Transcript_5994/m.6686 type:complete len:377 (+) Transcript_5994:66-1196(+)
MLFHVSRKNSVIPFLNTIITIQSLLFRSQTLALTTNTCTGTNTGIDTCSTILQMSSSASASSSSNQPPNKVIDSHLHVWADENESTEYPYEANQTPPSNLINISSTQSLLQQLEKNNVDGTLIVQPINHKYDHTYVLNAIKSHANKFKGMLLFDPSFQDSDLALRYLEDLVLKGFVGVRFNPYLWPENDENDKALKMSTGSGLDVYKRCGELNIPVGIMCFKGLNLHYRDIVNLLEKSKETTMILDHFGFTRLANDDAANDAAVNADDDNFQLLLSLQKYENVIIKISALFRIANDVDKYPFDKVKKERFDVLLNTFGKDRLMFGTDFPFVALEEGGYQGAINTVKSWTNEDIDVQNAIMYGTAERLFGVWGGVKK